MKIDTLHFNLSSDKVVTTMLCTFNFFTNLGGPMHVQKYAILGGFNEHDLLISCLWVTVAVHVPLGHCSIIHVLNNSRGTVLL